MLIYHHNDLDGYSAAYLIYKHFKESVNIDFEEINYPKVFPYGKVEGNKLVFFVDTSFGSDTIDNLLRIIDEYGCYVVWIDHHQTSVDAINSDSRINEYVKDGKLFAFVNTTMCGAMLTYAFFNTVDSVFLNKPYSSEDGFIESIKNNLQRDTSFNDALDSQVKKILGFEMHPNFTSYDTDKVPQWLYYVDMWDCWKHDTNNRTRVFNFQYGIDTEDLSPTSIIFSTLDEEDIKTPYLDMIMEHGKVINKYITKANAINVHNAAFETEINGIKTLCINNTNSSSLVFGDKVNDYPMVCVFYYKGSEKVWKYSVYSRETNGADCKEVAESYGGGGHPHASGFTTNQLIFDVK